ncbi:coatomer WD associated region-domain-containing protein [Phakopsora pachyrhizi]|nr:coatomer WD associated region-domain-containing protein [Phakopsora pachyrhizi]
MLLEVNRKLLARSERVKSVDFHPTEPWLLAGLYSGKVFVWHTETGALLKSFTPTEVPVRCARFIARKNWFVCGSDDFHLRAFNYNTSERIAAFEAHPDYIRCLAVHPTQSLLLTGSDDMTIKLWDWEKSWKCIQVFEGHTHYIMNLAFNPKDSNTFASSCLDRTVKVWSLGSHTANFTLDAHEKGVNYVEYYNGSDKPYMVTTGDDRLIKIWDYHSKSCIQTLEGHQSNVSYAIFHPSLPIIVSGSEDGTVKIWHASTYRLENTLKYGLERAWCIAYAKKGNDIGLGFDEGSVVIKLGKEEPAVSMDVAGKVVFTRNAEVLTTNVATAQDSEVPDGQKLTLSVRELGNTEVFAQSLQHSPNGRFVTVCGDGEFIIYTALAWRNKAFGPGLSFAWASDSNTYAVRESNFKLKIFRSFKEKVGHIKIGYSMESLFGGHLLGVKGSGFVCFYDWDSGSLVRRIEVEASDVYWSTSGDFLAISGEESFYILRYDRSAYATFLEEGGDVGDEGVEEAFDLLHELPEVVQTGKWVGDCFVYTNKANRLNYVVGGQTHTLSHFDQQMFLLGYLPNHNRVYLCDKDCGVYSFTLALSVIEYQTAILHGDLELASGLLDKVPQDQRNRIARFLESQDLKELALSVSTDIDHRFELATQLNNLDYALEITRAAPHPGSESKWRTIAEKALASWKVDLAEECFTKAGDLSALLLIYTSTGDRDGLERLSKLATSTGQNNIAFASKLQLGSAEACAELLLSTERLTESAMFSRTYAPSLVPKAVERWKSDLESRGKTKIAMKIANPEENLELFDEDWNASLEREKSIAKSGSAKDLAGG